jgi:hypothetical protein
MYVIQITRTPPPAGAPHTLVISGPYVLTGCKVDVKLLLTHSAPNKWYSSSSLIAHSSLPDDSIVLSQVLFFLRNVKIDNRAQERPLIVLILSPIDPVQTLILYIRSILTLSSRLRLSLPSVLLPSLIRNNYHTYIIQKTKFICQL